MKITRSHHLEDLYRLCVKERYCDMMTVSEYDAVLTLFKERGDDDGIIEMIARDIATHSAKYRDSNYRLDYDHLDEYVEDVAYGILNFACHYCVEV